MTEAFDATGLTTRPYTAADALAVAELMNLAGAAYGADPGFLDDTAAAIVGTVARDLARDSRMVFAADGTLVAFGTVSAPPPGGHRADTFAGVHPGWGRRGIGRQLLAWQLDRLAEMHAEQDPDGRWQVPVGTYVRDEGGIRLFEQFGMAPVRYFFDMVADPAAAPEMATPDGLRVVTYTPDLAEALYEAYAEAFSDHWGFEREPFEEFRSIALDAADFRPDLTVIAFDGAQIAAFVTSYDGAAGMHYIGHVGTRRPWRRRGLATALVAQSMAAAAAAGRTTSTLGVDSQNPTGALGVYLRVGFTERTRSVVYETTLPGQPPPG